MSHTVYIDPQSYNNLSLYDRGVLSSIPPENVTFIGSTLWDAPEMDGVETHLWFGYSEKSNPLSKAASYLGSLLRIARHIARRKPEVVHIQWLRILPADTLFLRFLRGKGIKTVFTAHNILPHDTGRKYYKAYSRYYRLVDHIIVHSDNTKKELIQEFSLPPEKISVIPHGVLDLGADPERVSRRKREIIKEYGLEGKTLFSSLGLQSIYKGTQNIINVWASTPELRNNPDIRLMLVGKNHGIDYSPVMNLDNVVIINSRISNEDFDTWIQLSSVILLPYLKISQSGVLFSALDNNIPVLVSNAGGIAEPLRYGNVGWNIGEPTPENLRAALLKLTSPGEIAAVASAEEDFSRVKAQYSWNRISAMTADLYDRLAL